MNNRLRWICDELTESLILVLYDMNNNKFAGSYEAKKIIKINEEKIILENDNINDIQEFLLYGIVRFVDTENSNEIIDIPVRNLYILYDEMSETFSNKKRFIDLDKLEAFTVEKNKLVEKKYGIITVSAYLDDEKLEISKDLVRIMEIAHNYMNMNMQEKFDAIKEVNDIVNINEIE